jgi:hypothetical protein
MDSPASYRDAAPSTTGLSFSYRPLTRPKEIRLLSIEPSTDPESPISLKILPITLLEVQSDPAIKYNALSYVWGKDRQDRLIKIDGNDFYVAPNLETALRNIRTLGNFCLWVDAISINQRDDLEKNVQVQLMNEIYFSADEVVIWLGEATPRSTLAIKHLNSLIIQLPDGRTAINRTYPVKDPRYAAAWTALGQDLMKRPWWKRMWVIQEIALAKRAFVLCGQDILVFEKLAMGCDMAFHNDLHIFYGDEDGFLTYWNLKHQQNYRQKKTRGEPLHLHELLVNNVSCSATDPRDIVFSLMGLATDIEDAEDLIPEYSDKTLVERLYTNLVKFHVRKYNTLDMICCSVHPRIHDKLPSWVPDWPSLKKTTSLSFVDLTTEVQDNVYCYGASGSSTPRSDVFASDQKVLNVSSILVDKIASTAVPFDEAAQCDEVLISWHEFVSQHFGSTKKTYITGGDVLEAYNRTICADRARSGQRAVKGQRGFEAIWIKAEDIPRTFRAGIPFTFQDALDIDPEVLRRQWIEDSLQAISLRAMRRKLFITEQGLIGLGPISAEKGDDVTIVLGCNVPVILRQDKDQWRFIGESFVCGIMDGEIVEGVDLEAVKDVEEAWTFLGDQGCYTIEKLSIV